LDLEQAWAWASVSVSVSVSVWERATGLATD
jgi:hypothetical protein